MGICKLDELKPGMVTSEPVFTKRGQLIVDKGVVLTKQLINHMHFYGITEASVQEGTSATVDAKKNAPQKVNSNATSEDELSYSQKIRKSPSFQAFQVDYTNYIADFNRYLKDFKDTSTLQYAAELQEIPKTLISQTQTSIEFFDMIHNLRSIDDSVYAHALNVAMIARMLGKWLELPEKQLDTLTLAGALHDVGKFFIPEEVLNKKGKLSDEEFSLIRQHPALGYNFLQNQDINYHVKQAALMHHERCDGSGYPNGLTTDNIDDFAMIIAIADVYDAMTAARKYRAPLCPFQVIAEFEMDGLSKYHPKYILTFLQRIANAYQNNRVLLNDGRSGNIILLNQNYLSKPMVQLENGDCLDLAKESNLYIQSIV
ncbi:MAG: HD-GYP domain-containing protein [Lachnospiraceae bacterium]|nr:HD-GYP domain-containing protein [Lachnospiraceae bacterium]